MIDTNLDPVTVLALLWGIFVSVFWMITGFRAMRAHERIANALETPPKPSS